MVLVEVVVECASEEKQVVLVVVSMMEVLEKRDE